MSKKLTTEEFIEKAVKVHGDKYCYDEVEYINSKSKVSIICGDHGIFTQRANSHLKGRGCSKCGYYGGSKSSNTEEFIKKAHTIHNHKYGYGDVEYVNCNIKVRINCGEHGVFTQRPSNHLAGNGCPTCSQLYLTSLQRSNTDEFIEKSIKVHGDKYDYRDVEYIKNNKKVKIICEDHGPFSQNPQDHLSGSGCKQCGILTRAASKSLGLVEFIKRSQEIHGNQYDYSNVDYTNSTNKVEIICEEHGPFYQIPPSHLKGRGCPKCGLLKLSAIFSSSAEEFIQKSQEIHSFLYVYDNVNYVNSKEVVEIICKKHGPFLQLPPVHLSGCGCPSCKTSKPVKSIMRYLERNQFEFEIEKRFESCRYKHTLPFDFYLPKEDLLIEYDGEWHYQPIISEYKMKLTQKRDKIKNEWCIKNNKKLLRIPYWEKNNIVKILKEELKL